MSSGTIRRCPGNRAVPDHQRDHCSDRYFKEKNGNFSEKAGFQTWCRGNEAGFKNRYSCGASGWVYPDRFYSDYSNCQPKRTERCGSGWNCGKADRNCVPGAVHHAFSSVCSFCTEYRSRKTGARSKNSEVRGDDFRGIRVYSSSAYTVCFSAGCKAVYWWCGGCCFRRTVPALLYLGLYACRSSFLFQRVLLCLWKIRNLIFT